MTRVFFLHNKAMWYNLPFFQELKKRMNVAFGFTDLDRTPDEIDFTDYRSFGIYPFIVTPGLIFGAIGRDYDVIVLPPPEEILNLALVYLTVIGLGKPYVVWADRWFCNEVNRPAHKRLYYAVMDGLFGHISRRADACITRGGTKQAEYYRNQGVEDERIFISPALSDIPATIDKPELNNRLEDDSFTVLCVARLIERKGVDYLIKAFSMLREDGIDAELILVGGEDYPDLPDIFSSVLRGKKPYGTELRQLTRDLDVEGSVRFEGYVDSDQLPQYYQRADVLVYPSTAASFADTCCLPVSDAMFFSTPVISTDVVAFAHDLIEDGENGYLVPQKDATALYNAMRKIADDGESQRMGQASRKRLNTSFTFEHTLEGFTEGIEYAIE